MVKSKKTFFSASISKNFFLRIPHVGFKNHRLGKDLTNNRFDDWEDTQVYGLWQYFSHGITTNQALKKVYPYGKQVNFYGSEKLISTGALIPLLSYFSILLRKTVSG